MQTHNYGNIDGEDAVDGLVGETGDDGARGVGFSYKGDWVAGGSYSNVGDIDVVKFKNDYYYCKKPTFRSGAPDFDTDTWGVFVIGESATILRATFSAGDWEEYEDETLQATVQKAVAEFDGVTIPMDAKYFINIDPDAAAVYGIKLAAVGNNSVTFYASTPCAVTIDFCFKTIKESVYQAEEIVNKVTTFTVTYNENTSNAVYLNTGGSARIVDWGDGTVDALGGHIYQSYGTYTARLNGEIGNEFFGRDHPNDQNMNITRIKFSEDKLGEYGCAYCRVLNTVLLSGEETSIPNGAFVQTDSLENVPLHDGILSIGDDAFYGSGIEHLDLPSTVEELGRRCFAASGLQSITIPPRVTIIPDYTFSSNRLRDVYMGSGISYIGFRAFRETHYCTIHYDGTIAEWDAIEKNYDWGSTTLTVICNDGYAQRP